MTAMTVRPGLMTHSFGARYADATGAGPGVGGLRATGRAMLAARGLPGPREESWRYTPLADLAKVPFVPAVAAEDIDVTDIPAGVPRLSQTPRLVLVNGVPRADLSDDIPLQSGVAVAELGALESVDRALLGALAPATTWPMAALNSAFVSTGIGVSANPGATARLHIVSVGAAGSEPVAFHPRILVKVPAGAALTLIVDHVGLPGQPYLSNPVVECDVAAGATLRQFCALAEDGDAFHASVTAVRLAAGATYEDFRLSLGGGKVRQDIGIAFTAEGARASVRGAYGLTRSEHHDLSTVVDHAVPGCVSAQEIKGVVAGRSHAVFQGRIRVAPNAQKSDARQSHKTLFLDAGPKVDCKPELEIFADDVQCAHGAATGEIDPAHMFYLMSRGIDSESARALLVEGFLDDVIGSVSDDAVRDTYLAAVAAWLKKRRATEAAA
jgi:Fe-S cluster assembly protein SufD